MHLIIPDQLDQAGLTILDNTPGVTYDAACKTREELLAVAHLADGLIIRSATKVDTEMFNALINAKAIARAGVGVDNVDLDVATQRGVVVMNAPDGNTIATAELAFSLMLSLARHIPQAHASMQAGKWDKKSYMGTELYGKTLGVVGFGRVGQAVAKRAQAFGMTVITYDPYIPAHGFMDMNVESVGLDDLFARSDYITLHTVATKETKGMINATSIAKMKDGVRIVNAARGTLINEADLAAALKSGKVAGAALDVYAEEPAPAGHPLVGLPNVINTPHLGASTLEAQDAVAVQAVHNLLDVLFKRDYRNVVNPAVLEAVQG